MYRPRRIEVLGSAALELGASAVPVRANEITILERGYGKTPGTRERRSFPEAQREDERPVRTEA